MSDSAFQTMYRDEFVAGYERGMSLLSSATTTDFEDKGGSVVFLVADSGGATARTRGINGLIPARADNLTQLTCTLQPWHDLVRKEDFNVFASQGNQRQIMQQTAMKVISRKTDDDIIAELDTATNDTTTAVKASLSLFIKARTILFNNDVPPDNEDDLFMVVTPSFVGYMLQVKEFANAQYVDVKPLSSGTGKRYRRYGGFNWIEHTGLTGKGTSSEKCYAFHRAAIGHAADRKGLETPVGYNEEQAYSFARVSGKFGTKLLQNNGVVQVLHDGSEYVAT